MKKLIVAACAFCLVALPCGLRGLSGGGAVWKVRAGGRE